MSDTPAATGDTPLRIYTLVAYALFVLAFANGVTAIVGVVIAYLKRDEARGTPYESHFANMIVLFWSAVALFVLFLAALGAGAVHFFAMHEEPRATFPLIGLGIGAWLCAVAFAVWYLYRAIKGFARALDGKAFR
jgi:uncharacterized membrane protein